MNKTAHYDACSLATFWLLPFNATSFGSIRAAQTPPPSLCPPSSPLPQPRLPTPHSPAHNTPVLLSRSPRPTRLRSGARCGLPAARRLAQPPATPPSSAPGHCPSTSLLPCTQRFWPVEKTNAGESELHNLGRALAALRELVKARHTRRGRLATSQPPSARHQKRGFSNSSPSQENRPTLHLV